MYLLINWNGVLQSIKDTWVPVLIPLSLLFLVFILIAIIRKDK